MALTIQIKNHSIKIDFDFRRIFDITYNGFSSITGLPTKMIYGDTKTITFNNTTGIPNAVSVSGATGSYTNPTLTLSNITITSVDESIIVTKQYAVTYSGFSGNTSELISSISASGCTIEFTSTTGIPTSVTVTGATGYYDTTTHILTLSNITGDVTITATNGSVSDIAYTKLLNIYNNSTPSEDSSCDNSLLLDNTTDNNLRFVGSKPCNYVYFNCTNPSNPSSSTCEKWRIIGVFNRNGNKVLKIINPTFYNNGNNVQFNSTNNSSFVLWTTNSLSNTLNDTSSSSSYYNSMAHTDNHNYIESVNWPVGATTSLSVKVDAFYNAENATLSSSSVPFGLLTVTDINYGTSDSSCYNTNINRWSSNCMAKSSVNWLYEGNEYTMIPYSTTSYYIYKMQTNYQPYRTAMNSNLPARVVTHLKTNVYLESGNGSINNPYILKLHD